MANKQEYKRCVVPCPRFITGGDTHLLCVFCLGVEHAQSVLEGADCEHCVKLSLRTLRSRRAFFEEDGSVRVPRGAGPAAAEAQRRLSSWGSHMDLVAGFETGPALSQPLPAESGASAQEGGRSAASPPRVEAPLLRLSSSEELDAVEVEHNIEDECSPARISGDEELMEVLTRAVAKLNIEWPTDNVDIVQKKSLLDERFLPSKTRPPRRELPFFPDLHTEVSRSWIKPASFRVHSPQTLNYSNIKDISHYGYLTMPPAEETLASYLSPESSSSLKAPTLPTKPLKATSMMVGKAYTAAGQAAGCLHTMSILQAYQADLLRDMDDCEEVSADAIRELRRATDLSLRATKETAKSVGRSMAALVATERHLWLGTRRSPDAQGVKMLRVVPSGEGRFRGIVSPPRPLGGGSLRRAAALPHRLFPAGSPFQGTEVSASPCDPPRRVVERSVRLFPAGSPLQGTEMSVRLNPEASLERLVPLAEFLVAWKLLPNISQWVLHVVEKGYRIQFGSCPPRFQGVLPTVVDSEQALVMEQEVMTLLRKGAIERVSPPSRESGFYSRYFIVPKKDGGLRPILDLRQLNRRVESYRRQGSTINGGSWSLSTVPGSSSKCSAAELQQNRLFVIVSGDQTQFQLFSFIMEDTQKSRDFSPGCSSLQQERSEPEPSCVSMRSDESIDHPVNFKSDDTQADLSSLQQERSEPEPSCVSMRSDESIDHPVNFKSDDTQADLRSIPPQRSAVTKPICKKNDQSMNQLQDFNESRYAGVSHEVFKTFRSNLMKKFECLYEGTAKQGNPTLLNEIYTELYITESESGEISNEHEVRQIETQSRRAATEDTPIKCKNIFRPLPRQDKHIRTVLTKGVAGIGKTVSVQKFILEWSEGKANQDVQLIFPLPFRELNLMKDKTLSLSYLLHLFFPETKEMEISSDKYKVLFIFDGLDECRLALCFQSDVRFCDASESASVEVLLINLIAGNLLPSALIWITSRPAAADLIPSKCVHRVTEVRGFNEPQKEEYFKKRISDQSLANTIITHLKSSRSLQIMCHIPVFCWISATVLEKMLSEAESGEIPKTLTQMYTHFLILQTKIKHEKDYEKNVTDEDIILKLGKVAFQQLMKGNMIFYEEDLRECGIDVTEASVYSGLCTQIFREEFGLYQGKVFCFVHLSVQEHLAALYVHLFFTNNNINVFDPITNQSLLTKFKDRFQLMFKHVSFSELHQRAVNEALQSKNGHLDLFLRFLLGLSVESHQILLQGLMTLRRRSDSNEKTAQYIKEKIRTIDSPEKTINLFHCLNELGDYSLVEEIQHYLKSGTISEAKLSSSQWSAVVFVLLTSEKKLDDFDLNKFIGENNKAEKLKVLQKLLPVIKVHLSDCGVTEKDCAALTSVLRSNPSRLRQLNLINKKLQDSGVKLLSVVLEDPGCKLEKLWLRDCGVTDEGCSALASALRSNPSHLRQLDLTRNKLGDSVNLLSALLEDPHCKLEILK
ncbi:unnamed protein product [Leuciscus chuanchicus]